MPDHINAVVDNWLLTLAGDLLDAAAIERLAADRGALDERIQALLHLLDVLVLHDTIFYDSEYASIWDGHPTLGQLAVTFSKIPLDTPTREEIVDAADAQINENAHIYLARTKDSITDSEQTFGVGDLIQRSITHGSIFFSILVWLICLVPIIGLRRVVPAFSPTWPSNQSIQLLPFSHKTR